ncbi:MAG: potassium channel family protein [Actinomycetes bacterium]
MTKVVAEEIEGAAKAGMRPVSFLTPSYRYGVVLGLLMVTFFFIGISPSGRFGPLFTLIIESVTLLVALSASGSRRVVVIVAAVASACAIATGVFHAIHDAPTDVTFTSGMSALLILVAPVAIASSVIRRRKLDVQAVLAAVSLYVMIGLFFSYVFALVQGSNAHHVFFVQASSATPSEFLYFSFTVMTTVGFGDFTAANGLGRTLSVFEAMVGQLYLVTVVALLVSNLGPAAAARRRAGGAAAAPAPVSGGAPPADDAGPGGSPSTDPADG